MTNEEAIEWLKSIDKKYIHGGDEQYDEQRHEAIKTAIKALEEPPKGKWLDVEPIQPWVYNQRTGTTGDYCSLCPTNPKNGGSGICNCILGTPKVTC